MKRFRIVIIALVVLFSVVMIFASLIPAETRVSRAINIRGNRDSMKHSLLDLRQWPLWHPNLKNRNDSNPVTFSAAGDTLLYNGFTVQVSPESDSSVNVDMTNREGNKMRSTINIIKMHGDTCAVNWYVLFHSKWYPWEKFRSMFYDQMHGPSLDSNLLKFKGYIEK